MMGFLLNGPYETTLASGKNTVRGNSEGNGHSISGALRRKSVVSALKTGRWVRSFQLQEALIPQRACTPYQMGHVRAWEG